MQDLAKLKAEIDKLSPQEFAQLRDWLMEFAAKQASSDSKKAVASNQRDRADTGKQRPKP